MHDLNEGQLNILEFDGLKAILLGALQIAEDLHIFTEYTQFRYDCVKFIGHLILEMFNQTLPIEGVLERQFLMRNAAIEFPFRLQDQAGYQIAGFLCSRNDFNKCSQIITNRIKNLRKKMEVNLLKYLLQSLLRYLTETIDLLLVGVQFEGIDQGYVVLVIGLCPLP